MTSKSFTRTTVKLIKEYFKRALKKTLILSIKMEEVHESKYIIIRFEAVFYDFETIIRH